MKKNVFCIVLFLVSLIVPTVSVVKEIRFDQQCGGFLKQAADASSVELAERGTSLADTFCWGCLPFLSISLYYKFKTI